MFLGSLTITVRSMTYIALAFVMEAMFFIW